MTKVATESRTRSLLSRKGNQIPDKTVSPGDRKSIKKNAAIVDIAGDLEKLLSPGCRMTLVIQDIRELFILNGIRDLPAWRRLNAKAKAVMYHLTLQRMAAGNGMVAAPFTMNLTNDLIEQLEHSEAKTVEKLKRDMKQKLKRAAGRQVQSYFTIEIDQSGPKGRPHLHGTILLTEKEIRAQLKSSPVRQALHSINDYSDNPNFKNKAVEILNFQADTGWASYLTKAVNINRLYMPNTKSLHVTGDCNREARNLWRTLQKCVNNPGDDHMQPVIDTPEQPAIDTTDPLYPFETGEELYEYLADGKPESETGALRAILEVQGVLPPAKPQDYSTPAQTGPGDDSGKHEIEPGLFS